MSFDPIRSKVNIEGYTNPVGYDEYRTERHGYWICTACNSSFFGGGNAIHNQDCSLIGRVERIGYGYSDPSLVYVLGPEEDGRMSPYDEKQIEAIKELAKAQTIIEKEDAKIKL